MGGRVRKVGDVPVKPMYKAMVNSPSTELLFDIDSSQTEIAIADVAKLPDAPNLATIGIDENAETILYTGKDSTRLLGVTRGFQGAASAWLAGVPVTRTFTEYDYDAIVENIPKLIEGETKDIITFMGGS